MRNWIAYCFLVVMFTACSNKKDGAALSRDTFTSLLIQMHILEGEYTFNAQLDPAFQEKGYQKYAGLFKQFNTDSTAVANTFDYYADKQTELLEIYRNVLDSLNAMAIKEQSPLKSK